MSRLPSSRLSGVNSPAVIHALFLRGSVRRKAGGLDTASYASSYAALVDLSLRKAGLDWRNVSTAPDCARSRLCLRMRERGRM